MVSTKLQEDILETVRQYNDRNEPIGKKMIYGMKFAAITTVQKGIRELIADGKLVEHMVTLERGTFCLLMIPDQGQTKDAAILQKMIDFTLCQSRKNADTLDKILKKLEESK